MDRTEIERIVHQALRRRALDNRGMLPPTQLAQVASNLSALLIEPAENITTQVAQLVERGLAFASIQEAGIALQRAALLGNNPDSALQIAERLGEIMLASNKSEANMLRREQEQLRAAVIRALDQERAETERQRVVAEQNHNEQQRLVALVDELSTPIVPVYDGILVLPLIGAIDTRRAQEIMERLLTSISNDQADCVIIDITGVAVVDTNVVQYLLQTARATRLLGAVVILVGINAEIAQTITQLGMRITEIPTLSDLQAGIRYALQLRGLAVQPIT